MSNDAAPQTREKIANTDPSLLLVRQPRINKKAIRLLLVSFAGVFLIAVMFAYSPKKQRTAAQEELDAEGNIIIRRPSDLMVNAQDYLPPAAPSDPLTGSGALSPAALPPELLNTGSPAGSSSYTTYDRRPRVELRQSPFQNQGQNQGGAGGSSSGGAGGQASQPGRDRRPIFYNALPVAITPLNNGLSQPVPPGGAAAFPAMPMASLENAYASDYQKQNMNSIKEEYLRNARNNQDLNSYLSPMYLPAIDPYHEIKSGTYIPITLISAVNSDIPGPIEAQVVENVYDSYSGQNVLIPRGTRVHGDYSSSVAFGQNRILIVWQRMTLPDGITINLQGMQGVDLSGMSGLADQVDYHIAGIVQAVGLSTVWDIGKAAAVSALTSLDFLNSLNEILTAQGSATVAANSLTDQIVASYAEKLLNQQPTITIREGIRGNIYVSKDIILPKYGVY
jgi:type IV secretory pathway VirB10-like protein